MYDENLFESGQEAVSVSDDQIGSLSPSSDAVSVSDGDSRQDTGDTVSSGDVSEGDPGFSDISAGDSAAGSHQDFSAYASVSPDYTEYFLSLQEDLVSIHSTLFLILIFLLLSWTEKKISVGVLKFTRERRR